MIYEYIITVCKFINKDAPENRISPNCHRLVDAQDNNYWHVVRKNLRYVSVIEFLPSLRPLLLVVTSFAHILGDDVGMRVYICVTYVTNLGTILPDPSIIISKYI